MLYPDTSVLSKKDILSKLESSMEGLKEGDVKKRQLKGLNTLSAHQIRPWEILLSQFKTSFGYLLIIASLISFLLGEALDGLIIIAFVLINALLGFFQEYRAEVSLGKLRKLISWTTNVKRDGEMKTINDEDVVEGDILLLKAGDLIPAEVRFIDGNDIQVDESILTGESVPVVKTSEPLTQTPSEIAEAHNTGFSGTLLSSGETTAIVIAIGNNTELGRIAKLTLETETQSGFSKRIEELSKAIIWVMAGTILFVLALHLLFKGAGLNIGELAVFSIALAVGVIPEALPLVITISLSTGALRLAHKKVVPKRLSAIEDLGSIDILCTDKTGTITENKLTVSEVFSNDKKRVLKLALLGSILPKGGDTPTDSFDTAIWKAHEEKEKEEALNTNKIAELPFDPVRRRNSVIIKGDGRMTLIVRGAYEEISELCLNKDFSNSNEVISFVKTAGHNGKRTIAVASKNINDDALDIKNEERNLTFEGIISFSDPLKHSAKNAILEAEKLGIQIRILTGDAPEVAANIGREIGLIKDGEEIITGKDYDLLSEGEKTKFLDKIIIFARVSPEQKFDIIKRLKEKHTVGFLGEGFNDAPAVKEAHVGLVVDNASDVTKDAADIILLSKSLETIINGVKEGRTTFTNTIKYIRTTLTSNFGNFIALAFSSLFIPFLPMLPIQILLVNLLTDFPMIAVSTDTVSGENLKKPKKYAVKSIIALALLLGLVSTFFDFTTFFYFLRFGSASLQTLWFTESVLTELALLFSIRTSHFFLKGSKPSSWIVILTVVTFISAIFIPFSSMGRAIFGFKQPEVSQMATVFMLVALYFVITETVKLIYYKVKGDE